MLVMAEMFLRENAGGASKNHSGGVRNAYCDGLGVSSVIDNGVGDITKTYD
jgi:hypothetical protein